MYKHIRKMLVNKETFVGRIPIMLIWLCPISSKKVNKKCWVLILLFNDKQDFHKSNSVVTQMNTLLNFELIPNILSSKIHLQENTEFRK